ncbi:hypothetical protein LZ30DRAFT_757053 [Colletotrichum cereale]|nr:hypothetical protein LZ30DRAFT_757053 [Colletotrichum cereale]
MAAFGLFGSLPAELRLRIWRFTLRDENPRLVGVATTRDGSEHRGGKLPAISAVNRESRDEFLRLYVRLTDPLAPADKFQRSRGYVNPRMDGLVLGVDGDYDACLGRGVPWVFLDRYALGDMIEAPVLPQAARERIRDVRLHDVDFVSRVVKGSIRDREQSADVGSREALGAVRLPPLRFPNLSTIWIVSLSMSDVDFEALIGPAYWALQCLRSHFGFAFRYSQSSGRVYAGMPCMDRSEITEGCKSVRLPPGFARPGPHFFVRIDLQAGDSEPPFGDWALLEDVKSVRYSIWRFSVRYAALRLGEDRGRD